MGSRTVKFSFTPGENEQIETVIKVPEEHRSIIHGTVKDHHNKVIKDAVVKLYEALGPNGEHTLKPLTHTFTDDCGQFVFGPLIACKHYVIKVWINDVKIRELIIQPNDDICTYHNKSFKKATKPFVKKKGSVEELTDNDQHVQRSYNNNYNEDIVVIVDDDDEDEDDDDGNYDNEQMD